jgi:hypothetical protein
VIALCMHFIVKETTEFCLNPEITERDWDWHHWKWDGLQSLPWERCSQRKVRTPISLWLKMAIHVSL